MTWTDPTGLEREGEVIDTAETTHPTAGVAIATLYRIPANRQTGAAEQYMVDLCVGGKTHCRNVLTLENGRAHMTKFRGN